MTGIVVTVFVLAHERRGVRPAKTAGLGNKVEIDGAYFGGSVRPENRKEDRKDHRLEANQSPERRVVIVLRQRKGHTLMFVTKPEATTVRDVVVVEAAAAGAHRLTIRLRPANALEGLVGLVLAALAKSP